MRYENNLWRRREEIIEANEKLTQKITNQSRVKCKHCGKLTPIFENIFFKERINEKK